MMPTRSTPSSARVLLAYRTAAPSNNKVFADETITFNISSPEKFFNVIYAIRTAGFAQAEQSRMMHGGPAAQNAAAITCAAQSPPSRSAQAARLT
jgi:hypothetical protein